MATVHEWTWGGAVGAPQQGFPPQPDDHYQCESVDDPTVNSTGRSQTQSRELFVGAWNTKYGDKEDGTPYTESDFTFIQRPTE